MGLLHVSVTVRVPIEYPGILSGYVFLIYPGSIRIVSDTTAGHSLHGAEEKLEKHSQLALVSLSNKSIHLKNNPTINQQYHLQPTTLISSTGQCQHTRFAPCGDRTNACFLHVTSRTAEAITAAD